MTWAGFEPATSTSADGDPILSHKQMPSQGTQAALATACCQ